MGWFDAFREEGSNTYYGQKRNAVVFDINIVAIVFFTVVTATALIIFVIGSRGRERWTTLLRFVLSMHTGVLILVCIHGTGWQSGHIQSYCDYTASYQGELKVTIGVLVGLKYVNITLTGQMNVSEYSGYLDYNERFSYNKVYNIEMEYQDSLSRGLPWPIISTLEYISIDKGDLQWMRGLHESGHFSYILLWCAFVTWGVSNVLIGFVVARGAALWAVTGALMIVADVVYDTLQPIQPLKIPFKDGFLTFHYDWCFWLQILSGVLTFLTGIAILVFHHVYSEKSNLLFLVDRSYSMINNTHQQDITFTGPLELPTPYTERKRRIPHSYSNPTFSHSANDTVGSEMANIPRKQSFDFGHLTYGKTSSAKVHKSKTMTSIFESATGSSGEHGKEHESTHLGSSTTYSKDSPAHAQIDNLGQSSTYSNKPSAAHAEIDNLGQSATYSNKPLAVHAEIDNLGQSSTYSNKPSAVHAGKDNLGQSSTYSTKPSSAHGGIDVHRQIGTDDQVLLPTEHLTMDESLEDVSKPSGAVISNRGSEPGVITPKGDKTPVVLLSTGQKDKDGPATISRTATVITIEKEEELGV